MADQPQREEETNCRGEGSCMSGQLQREEETNCREEEGCMSGQLQGEEETNCRRGEEGCMSGQPQREEKTNCRGEEGCMSGQPQREESCASIPPAAGSENCFVPASNQLSSSDWTVVKRLWSEGNCIFDGLKVGRKCI